MKHTDLIKRKKQTNNKKQNKMSKQQKLFFICDRMKVIY